MTELLLVDLGDPSQSRWFDPKFAGAYMLGKDINFYRFFTFDDSYHLREIVMFSADAMEIQRRVKEAML